MRRRSMKYRAPLVAIAALSLIALSPSPSSASEDPVGDVLDQVGQQVSSVTKILAPPTNKPSAQAPRSGSAGTGTAAVEKPKAPDHATANVVGTSLAGTEVAGVGGNTATINDDDSTKADSTLLALGGQEVLGTHADSTGTNDSSFGDPLAPVCEGSGGAACLQVLYATASATDNGSTSKSKSRSGIANACLGGSSSDPAAPCTGPIKVGAASSEAEAERNQQSGQTTASSLSDVADVCIQPAPGVCALSVGALHSEGQADSGGSTATADRSSYLLDVGANGASQGRVDDPIELIVPPAPLPAVVTAALNQGDTFLGTQTAAHVQDALKVVVLPGVLDLIAGVGHTETLVHNDGGNPPPPNPKPHPKPKPKPSPPNDNQVLPNTGGLWSGLLALGLLSIAAGGFITAYGRRERVLLGG